MWLSLERDNRLRALYGDIMKAMLAINEDAREDNEMERQDIRVQIMMGEYRAKTPPEQCAYLRERR